MSLREKAIQDMNTLGKQHIPFLFVIDFEQKKPLVIRANKINSKNIKFHFNRNANIECECRMDKDLKINKNTIKFEEYQKAFEKVKQNIDLGNTYLLNLTKPSKIITDLTFDEIFFKSKAKYKMNFENKFVFFSPETFVKIERDKISSYPMKGTIDAKIENAESIILNDQKEIAEHNTIVDLIRNDLNMVAKNVAVENFRYIEKIKTNNKTLLQVSSKITGDLPKDYQKNIGDIIFKLLPAGSISGAPKRKTLEIIKQAENYTRGYYTGIAGYFDGRCLDSCVIIRYIEKEGKHLFYKSGGGITSFSNLEKEYKELEDKIYIPI